MAIKENMNREQAIAAAGIELVEAAEKENAYDACMCLDNNYDIWKADAENDDYRVSVIYLQHIDNRDIAADDMDWDIDHYEVEKV